jgi:mono/diheme cytochrome c family protein
VALKHVWTALLLLAATFAGQSVAARADAILDLTIGGETRSFTQAALLSRPDGVEITVPHDISYGATMTYRAVPLSELLSGLSFPAESVLEAVASDGFAAQLPIELVTNRDLATAVAYVAVEEPARPWPKLPGKQVSAGPFYLVWLGKEAGSIRSEQWPYQMAHLVTQPAPAKRWPALAVDSTLPATDPIRAGQSLFVTQCLVCHQLNHAGSAEIGPDLNLPMNPTEYFQPAALHRYIRDPASVRHWSAQKMQAFGYEQLSDHDIDLIVAYLDHMVRRKVE